MIQGECTACGRIYKVDDRYAGMTGRCKACGAPIRVPGEPDGGLDGLPAVEEPEQTPPAPTPSPPPEPQGHPPPADKSLTPEPLRPHDARSRYEPSHGPTALEGSWLKDQPAAAPRPAREPEEGPRAGDVLPSSRLVTDVAAGAAVRRPILVTLSCILIGLLAVGFFIHFVSAQTIGAVAAAIGALLGGMAVLRLWTGYWDGALTGTLFCLCVVGGSFLPSSLPVANVVLLIGALLALVLVLLSVLRPTSRDYFSS